MTQARHHVRHPPVLPLHVLLAHVQLQHLGDEELLGADLLRKMLQHVQSLVHARTLPPHLIYFPSCRYFPNIFVTVKIFLFIDLARQRRLEEDEGHPEEHLDPLAEEHVPDPVICR